MTTKEKHRCSGRVYDSTGMGGMYGCSRNGTHFEDDEWWCHQHLPSNVKKREALREEKWRLEREKWKEVDEVNSIKKKLYDAYLDGRIPKDVVDD